MNTRRFVTGSSFILAAWLGATFFNEVPAQRYPKLDQKTANSTPTGLESKLAPEAAQKGWVATTQP